MTTQETTMSKTEMTLTEMAESLDGFEEQRIVDQFGRTLDVLLEDHATMGMRALIAAYHGRGAADVTPNDAKKYAMGLTMREVGDFFASVDDDEPVDPMTLETESGKGEQPAS